MIKATTSQISENLMYKDILAVKQNINYPVFSHIDDAPEEIKSLCRKLNTFYSNAAKSLSSNAQKRLCKRAYSAKCAAKDNTFTPFGVYMNCTLSHYTENFISIITDISFFDGKTTQSRRIPHTWDIKKAAVIPTDSLFDSSREKRAQVRSYVISCVEKNCHNPYFAYYGDAPKLAQKNFSLSNAYLVPKGKAIFYQPGILCEQKYGPCVFVLKE